MTTESATPAAGEPTDVMTVAAGQVPDAPAWLWVTGADWAPGGAFTACPPGAGPGTDGPRAFGGDVLIAVAPPPHAGPGAAVTAAVHAVVAGHLVRVATLSPPGTAGWPEQARPVVAATISVLTAIGEHLDLGEDAPVSLGDPARAAAADG